MGHRIKTYSLSELNKISTPGKVVPALFWLIPIGEWRSNELERLWHQFTKSKSTCNEMGLMLVNDTFASNYDPNQTSNLSDLTGRLSDILPSGTSRIYGEEFQPNKKRKKQALILSGAYPQPGWGVLISFNKELDIDKLVENAIDPNLKTIFIGASKSYKVWNDLKGNKPIKENVEYLKKGKEHCLRLNQLLNSILSEYNEKHINDFYFQVLKNKQNATSSMFYEEYFGILNPLFEIVDDRFILSLMILKSLKDLSKGEINSVLKRFLSEHHHKTNNLFKSEINNKIKVVAGKLLKLTENEKPTEKFDFWANSIYNSKIDEIAEIIKSLNEKFIRIIGDLVITIDNQEEVYNSELKEWNEKEETSRISFHRNLQKVLNAHLTYGQGFLLNIENLTKELNLYSKSFSWDPARMIGGKIISAGVQIETLDIIQRVKEIIPEFSSESNNSNYDKYTLINGSLFTDFVHYISLKDPSLSPREATKQLLEKTIRSSEIIKVLKKENNSEFKNKTNNQMVETLLVEFGWPADEISKQDKLADCIIENQGINTINTSFTGNHIRKICENYFKDLVDTLSSSTGFSAEELFGLVMRKDPEFRSKNKGWHYEISKLTFGSASRILSVLLSEVYPDKIKISEHFIKSITNLGSKLNGLSHDPPVGETSSLIEDILALLKYTKELISEMPWHFYPVQRNGYQPTVLTGSAWSHSYKESRQLSIILWTNDNSESLLIWNPTKVNPVVPDGIIINRPQN
ncbi:hypothetical protein K8354_13235 [Polaribacter litorisediminis]|uniref:hypothetical protein n=1 Tax=Polaribacter litorisediminis TaxID=1908341 RepID=UPI001CBAE034|nr:hypothetical protein [Polaribacter litorisediminis]UAM97277.1 hypothetical protein K8354_13235 [Polaribacter litorisediminis]